MQGNIFGQSGGGLKMNEIIKSYQIASGGNVNAGDFVKFIEKTKVENEVSLMAGSYSPSSVSSGKFYVSGATVLSESKVFILYNISSSSSNYYYGVICNINETIITVRNMR